MSGFQLGELILVSKPYAYVLDNTSRGKRCDYCFKKHDGLISCNQCAFHYYCNRSCQENAWEEHKEECGFLLSSRPELHTSSLRLLALVIFKLQKYGYDKPSVEVYGRKVSFQTLLSHAKDFRQSLKYRQQMLDAIEGLKYYIGPSNVPPRSEFVEIFGKIWINSFYICDEELVIIGRGLYLGASVFDHSCQPDAEVVFDGINLSIRATKNIPHRDTNQIFISYIEQLQWTKNRRDMLKERYFFSCQCGRCLSSDYDDLMKIYLVSEKDHWSKFNSELENFTQLKEGNDAPSSTYAACVQQLVIQGKIFSDTHDYVKSLEVVFDECVESKQWADAIIIGRQLLKPYRLFYGPYHPRLGIHLFKIGKSQLLQGLSASCKTLMEAANIIKLSHGKTHPLFQDVSKLLSESKALMCSSNSNFMK